MSLSLNVFSTEKDKRAGGFNLEFDQKRVTFWFCDCSRWRSSCRSSLITARRNNLTCRVPAAVHNMALQRCHRTEVMSSFHHLNHSFSLLSAKLLWQKSGLFELPSTSQRAWCDLCLLMCMIFVSDIKRPECSHWRGRDARHSSNTPHGIPPAACERNPVPPGSGKIQPQLRPELENEALEGLMAVLLLPIVHISAEL